MRYLHLFSLFVFLLFSSIAFGNDSTAVVKKNLSKTVWKEATKNLDYRKTPKEYASNWQPPDIRGWGDFFSALAPLLKLVVYLLIAALIGLLLYVLVGKDLLSKNSNKRIKQGTESIDIEAIERNPFEVDLQNLLRNAIEAGEYKLAVRLYYLILIKELSLKNHIYWKKDKPNYQYLQETSKYPYHPEFQKATMIFEYVWYGDTTIQSAEYSQIATTFSNLQKNI